MLWAYDTHFFIHTVVYCFFIRISFAVFIFCHDNEFFGTGVVFENKNLEEIFKEVKKMFFNMENVDMLTSVGNEINTSKENGYLNTNSSVDVK